MLYRAAHTARDAVLIAPGATLGVVAYEDGLAEGETLGDGFGSSEAVSRPIIALVGPPSEPLGSCFPAFSVRHGRIPSLVSLTLHQAV